MVSVEHIPVLYREVIESLALHAHGRYIDCTLGSGGHARGILEHTSPDGQLLGLDTDPEALERCRSSLLPFSPRMRFVHANFRYLAEIARREGWCEVDGILLDLGVNSVQLATAARGFSFQESGPLDMRLDPTSGKTAATVVNTLSEEELASLFFRYGEEPKARAIAARIVQTRSRAPFVTTKDLAETVLEITGRHGRLHPATRVFQALRIFVNEELVSIEEVLPQAVQLLRPGGRLVVIAFHSLEDRIVKHFLHSEAKHCHCPPHQLICTCTHQPLLRLLGRHARIPSVEEVAHNPRARSAKLRVAERL